MHANLQILIASVRCTLTSRSSNFFEYGLDSLERRALRDYSELQPSKRRLGITVVIAVVTCNSGITPSQSRPSAGTNLGIRPRPHGPYRPLEQAPDSSRRQHLPVLLPRPEARPSQRPPHPASCRGRCSSDRSGGVPPWCASDTAPLPPATAFRKRFQLQPPLSRHGARASPGSLASSGRGHGRFLARDPPGSESTSCLLASGSGLGAFIRPILCAAPDVLDFMS